MTQKRLDQLTDAELAQARKYLEKLTTDVTRDVQAMPFADWSTVIAGIETAHGNYEAECARRYGLAQ